jgi:hypothetical protein
MPDELTLLDTAEQELHAQLKSLRSRKQLALQEVAEQAALEAQLRHDAHMQRVQALKPVTVLGASYESVRKLVRDNGLRVVKVHPDILNLLRAALPAKDEQYFYQLCSALVERLMINQQAMDAIAALKADSATVRYFESEDASVVIVLTGRLATMRPALVSEIITAYALEWGKATNYEENEVSE